MTLSSSNLVTGYLTCGYFGRSRLARTWPQRWSSPVWYSGIHTVTRAPSRSIPGLHSVQTDDAQTVDHFNDFNQIVDRLPTHTHTHTHIAYYTYHETALRRCNSHWSSITGCNSTVDVMVVPLRRCHVVGPLKPTINISSTQIRFILVGGRQETCKL